MIETSRAPRRLELPDCPRAGWGNFDRKVQERPEQSRIRSEWDEKYANGDHKHYSDRAAHEDQRLKSQTEEFRESLRDPVTLCTSFAICLKAGNPSVGDIVRRTGSKRTEAANELNGGKSSGCFVARTPHYEKLVLAQFRQTVSFD